MSYFLAEERPPKGKKALGVFGTSRHDLYQSLQEGCELFPLSLHLKPVACAKLWTSLILNEKHETKQISYSNKAISPTWFAAWNPSLCSYQAVGEVSPLLQLGQPENLYPLGCLCDLYHVWS